MHRFPTARRLKGGASVPAYNAPRLHLFISSGVKWVKQRGAGVRQKEITGTSTPLCQMSGASTAGSGVRPLGDLTYADVSESVLCWLPVNRSTLDALSHACRATRAQIARHRDFGRTTFVCDRGCHIRFSQELDAPTASCAAILRHSDQLSSLHGLSLNRSSLRADEIAAIVSKCPLLRTLHLRDTYADDKVVSLIACLAHLETLDIWRSTSITDLCLLAACRTLKSIKLTGTHVDDRAIAAIVSLPCLEELSVDGCESIADFTQLHACLSLKRLSADCTCVGDVGLAAIVSLPCLEELCLNCCESITDFTPLRSCKSLKRLFLRRRVDNRDRGFDDRGLAAVASLPCLEELILDNCESISDFAPLRSCKSLKKVSAECTKLDDRGLVAVVSLLRLEELSLNGCSSITDFTPLRMCESLKRLSLNRSYDGKGLDDRGLAAIVSLPYLEELSLDCCASITDWTLLRTRKSLKVLSVRWTSIDDRGVAAVASLPRLEKLDVSGCSLITDVTPLASRHSLKVTSRLAY